MNRKRGIYRAATLLVVIIMVVFAAACGSNNNSPAESTDSPAEGANTPAVSPDNTDAGSKLKIAIVPKTVGHPYFIAAEKGAKKAGEDFGVDVTFTGPSVEDLNKQITVIEDLITQKVDALIIAPVDSDALVPVIKKAFDAGIPTFTFDIDAPNSQRLFNVTAGDPEESGTAIANSLAKSVDYKGEVALLTGGLGQDALNRRLEAIKSTLAQWPDIKVVATEASDEDFQKGVSQVENLLQTYPNLKGLAGVSTVNPPSAATVVQAAGLAGKVAVTGIGLPSQNAEFIKAGVISELFLWDPGVMTYDAVKAAIDYIQTQKLPVDGQDFGWGGKLLVKDNVVGYVPSLIFNKDNIDDFDF